MESTLCPFSFISSRMCRVWRAIDYEPGSSEAASCQRRALARKARRATYLERNVEAEGEVTQVAVEGNAGHHAALQWKEGNSVSGTRMNHGRRRRARRRTMRGSARGLRLPWS